MIDPHHVLPLRIFGDGAESTRSLTNHAVVVQNLKSGQINVPILFDVCFPHIRSNSVTVPDFRQAKVRDDLASAPSGCLVEHHELQDFDPWLQTLLSDVIYLCTP